MIDIATAPTQEQLNEKAIERIIEQAARLSSDKSFKDIWRDVYEPAKAAIREFALSADAYQAAIAALTEAMKV